MTRRIMLVGATSAIVSAIGEEWARENTEFFLVARSRSSLAAVADRLTRAGGSVRGSAVFEAESVSASSSFFDESFAVMGSLDVVLIGHGLLVPQAECEEDLALALQQFYVNALSVMVIASQAGRLLAKQGYGKLVVISSVAGDRGRRSNYFYGASKGAVSIFLEGLSAQLHQHGVTVVTVKPGLVDTPMTVAYKKGFLWSTPAVIAPIVCAGVERGRAVIYAPSLWRWIMIVIRHIPSTLLRRLPI